jgi:hypothetical protein
MWCRCGTETVCTTLESHQFSQQRFGINSGWQIEGHSHSSFLKSCFSISTLLCNVSNGNQRYKLNY